MSEQAGMSRVSRWTRALRSRPGRVAAAAVALLMAVPITIAVLHEGFPLTTAEHYARTVWVSNGSLSLAGRINRQIDQLTSSVVAGSLVDIAQDGDDVFTLFEDSVARVDPAFAQLSGKTSVPGDLELGYGGGRLLLTRSATGDAWVVDTRQPFVVDPGDPTLSLGRGGVAAISRSGLVMGYSPRDAQLTVLSPTGGEAQTRELPQLDGELSMTMVGERGVILDADAGTLTLDDGTTFGLDVSAGPLRLQQPGPTDSRVLVESVDALVEVDLATGEDRATDVGGTATSTRQQLAAPVRVAGCAYGAWTANGTVVARCGDSEPRLGKLTEQAGELRFRVNRDEVVLNDIRLGSVYLLDEDLTQIADWQLVPQTLPDENDDGTEQNDDQAVEDTPPVRSAENTRPVAVDDDLGARPGQTTILPVLDNDTDVDGDMLVVSAVDQPGAAGTIELVDGGRALQFAPADGFLGSFTVRYTASDGRPGGEASAAVTVRVGTQDTAPMRLRNASVQVEQGQTISYNVLADWIDPDGDEIYLKSATGTSGDTVRSTPDGLITFTSLTSELGPKIIDLVVADGTAAGPATATFTVRVVAPGTIPPAALPDLVTMTAGRPATIRPLENDRNPSSAELLLTSVTPADPGIAASLRSDGDVSLTSSTPGTHYVEYTISAGSQTATGVIRVEVRADAGEPAPPIAVRDVAYLRPDQSVDLAVLANDVSPDGLVLGVQSVTVDPADTSVTVEILKNTLLRVSSSSTLQEGTPVRFSYTVSDGGPVTATATVVVIPVPALLSHQPPLPAPDQAIVRAGDYVDVDVLDNDVHPDGSRMDVTALADDLPADGGYAFLSGNQVRYQAPDTPGSYTVGYEVTDEFGQLGASTVTFAVTEVDVATNQPPAPPILTARVFQGSNVLIELPSGSLDPDGDSVVFGDVASAPALGVVTEQGSASFRYVAAEDASGTDEFQVTLVDALGGVGAATVRIGVMPRPGTVLPPSAVDDIIAVRPGGTATVAPLANDSDPSGLKLRLVPDELVVDTGPVTAEVDDIDPNQIVITVPDEVTSGSYYVGYGIQNSDDIGDSGRIIVQVDPQAPLLPPIAFDHVVDPDEIADSSADRIDVDVLSDARNPSGRLSDLEVTVDGPGAAFADVTRGGAVSVQLGESRRVVAYTVTNADGLTASAFVVVPDREAALRPRLRADVGEQQVTTGALRTWSLGDLVESPSGGALRVLDAGTATHAVADFVVTVDADHVSYQSAADYTGPASITFQVADGDPDDSGTRTAFITVPILVTGPDAQAARVPTFAGGTQQVMVADQATVELRSRTSYDGASTLRYDQVAGGTNEITASLTGDTLTLRAAPGSVGKTAKVTFRISGDGFDPVTASLDVVVIQTNLPSAKANEDVLETRRPQISEVYPLANDVNPYPADQPLSIVEVVAEENGASVVGQPEVRQSDGRVRVTPTAGFVGTISLRYVVQDASGEESRQVSGTIRLVYRDVPDNDLQVTRPAVEDRQLSPVISAAPKDNNSPIDGYQMTATWSGGSAVKDCAFGQVCLWTGLTNDVQYCFAARAHNAIGWGAYSGTPVCQTPYGKPQPAYNLVVQSNYEGIFFSWDNNPNDPAGAVTTLRWVVNGTGYAGDADINAPSVAVPVPGGSAYTVTVSACNVKADPDLCSDSIASTSPPVPRKPTVTNVYRGQRTPGEESDWIVAQFADYVPGGQYRVCVDTTAGSGTHWYNSPNLAGDVDGGAHSDCALGTIQPDGTIHPFGLTLDWTKGASIRVWLTYDASGNYDPLSSNPNQRWFVDHKPGY